MHVDKTPRAATLLIVLLLALVASSARLDAAEAPRMKRIVLCLDGTWNNPERDKERGERVRYKPTNVLKAYRAIPPTADDGTSQVAFYLEGVGAFVGERTRFGRLQSWTDRIFGGVFGGGFEGRVKAAYRFLVANYEPGDEIYVFGFSRGAAQAQSLVRFIDWTGGILHKEDEYYIPELFDRFRDSRADPAAGPAVFEEIRRRRRESRGDRPPGTADEPSSQPKGAIWVRRDRAKMLVERLARELARDKARSRTDVEQAFTKLVHAYSQARPALASRAIVHERSTETRAIREHLLASFDAA